MGAVAEKELLERISANGFRPRLRLDLTFERGASPASVTVYNPQSKRRFPLRQAECLVAQSMDGTNDLDALCQIATSYDPTLSRERVAQLAVQLAKLGALEGFPTAAQTIEPAALSLRPKGFGTFQGEFLQEVSGWEAPTQVDPVYTSQTIPFPRPPVVDEMVTEPEVAPPAAEAVHSAPEPAPEPHAPEPAPPAAPPASEAPDPWGAAEPKVGWSRRWYVRLGKVVVVLGTMVAALALWRYPLYVTEPCVIIPQGRVMVRAVSDGILREVLVDEGTEVKQGQVIALLDDRTLHAERRKAAAEIARVTANLQQLKHGARIEEIDRLRAVVHGARQDLSFASRELSRYTELVANGVAPVEKRDAAARDKALKQKTLEEAEANLRLLLAGTRAEEIDAAKAELARAQAEADYLDERIRQTQIVAPIDGRILTPKLRERVSDRILAGGEICEIANSATVSAEIFVPEREVDAVQIGLPTTVKVESFPNEQFYGTVELIAETVQRKDDLNYIRVITKLQNRGGLLKQDMTGWAEVNAGKRSLLYLATRRLVRWIHVRFLI
jgi:HlyD family secretion protein